MITRVRLALTRWSHRLFRDSSPGPKYAGRHCATSAHRPTAGGGPTGGARGAGKQQTRARDVAVACAAEMEAKLAQVESDLRARGRAEGTVYRNQMLDVGVVSAPGITVWVFRGKDGVLRNRDVLQECSLLAAGPASSSRAGTGARRPHADRPAYGDLGRGFGAGTVGEQTTRERAVAAAPDMCPGRLTIPGETTPTAHALTYRPAPARIARLPTPSRRVKHAL